MRRNRIAIVGGGCAGTVAAWALREAHDVTLFESGAALGGHAHSERVMVGDREVNVDMGVEYFTERLSPNLCEILRRFGIETFLAPLSFRAEFPGVDLTWSNLDGRGGLRARLNMEMDRFQHDMIRVLASGDPSLKRMSIDDYLAAKGYSDDLRQLAIVPLMSTFSGCEAPSLQYSLMYLALSINMHLLSFFSPGLWRKARGGIGGYLAAIGQELGARVRLSSPVKSVRHSRRGGLDIVDATGRTESFDTVIFATHADVTLAMIEAPSAEQRRLLGGFEYVPIRSVLHRDSSLIGDIGAHSEYCEFRGCDDIRACGAERIRGDLTRITNRLVEYRELQLPLLVTFDPRREPRAATILAEKCWKLPKLRPADLFRKTQLRRIQGVGNCWYCGTDTSFTGHEGALVSGLVIANRLGAPYPFPDNTLAKVQFNLVRSLMGVTAWTDQVPSMLGDAAFSLLRRTRLYQAGMHRVIGEILM